MSKIHQSISLSPRSATKELLWLALPLVAVTTSRMLMGFIDVTMVSRLGTEALAAPQRRFKGNTDLFNNDCYATGSRVAEPNLRWLDRLSVATTDLTVNQLPVLISSFPDLVSAFSGVAGYQRIPEWFVFLKATEVVDFNTLGVTGSQIGSYHTATAPTDEL